MENFANTTVKFKLVLILLETGKLQVLPELCAAELGVFIVQVLNSKLGIALRVSVTSATILTAKRTIPKIH